MRRSVPAAGLVLAVALALAACAQPAAEPTAWQQSVQTVAEQASAGDYASALAGLDALEAEVTARRDAGEITVAEADAILARIATVRSDLTSLTPAPSPTPAEESTEPEETTEPEPSETAEPEPTPSASPTAEAPDDGGGGAGEQTPSEGNGNKGPGGGGPGGKDDKKPGDGASPDPGKEDG